MPAQAPPSQQGARSDAPGSLYDLTMPITVCRNPVVALQPGFGTCNPAYSGQSFVPQISSIAPFTVAAGAGDQTMHVYGSGFTAASVVYINNVSKTTTLVNSGEVTATLSTSGLVAGNYPVKVKGPGQDSGTIYLEIS